MGLRICCCSDTEQGKHCLIDCGFAHSKQGAPITHLKGVHSLDSVPAILQLLADSNLQHGHALNNVSALTSSPRQAHTLCNRVLGTNKLTPASNSKLWACSSPACNQNRGALHTSALICSVLFFCPRSLGRILTAYCACVTVSVPTTTLAAVPLPSSSPSMYLCCAGSVNVICCRSLVDSLSNAATLHTTKLHCCCCCAFCITHAGRKDGDETVPDV